MNRPKTVREYVYEQIKSQILEGVYRPGQRLIETNLAEELGVSRTPVRDALNRLETEGLITTSPHRGIFVKKLSKKDIQDFYQTRAVLEGLAAKLAAQNATEHELRQFREFIREMTEIFERDKDLSNYKTLVQSNNEFHRWICRMAKNEVLAKMLADLASPITLVRSTSWTNNERKYETFKEHLAIADAILHRDAASAQKNAEAHIDNAWKSAAKALEKKALEKNESYLQG
ncbi:GntR family transcriptional regulator [Bacillaceae bacterium]